MDSYLRKTEHACWRQGSLNVWIMLIADAQVLSLHSTVMLKLPQLAMKVHSMMAASAFHDFSISGIEFTSLATRAEVQMSCIC